MTRKLLTLLVCVVIASSSFITVFAEAETVSTPDYVASYEEPTELRPFFSIFGSSTFSVSSSKNYSYDISKMDWYTGAPSAVTDVYKMTFNQNPTASTRQPFVFVSVVSNTRAVALVGVNVGPFFRRAKSSSDPYGYFYIGYHTGLSTSYNSHYLYRAAFDVDGNITENWSKLSFTELDRRTYTNRDDTVFYYSDKSVTRSTHVRDFYFYGVNGFCFANYATISYTGDNYEINTLPNHFSGGFGSYIIPNTSSYNFPSIYQEPFSVPTLEQWQQVQEQNRHEETGNWISRLGDRISGFFETLKNWLLWFSAEGSASYNNPFSNILTDIQSFFDQQVSDTNDFKNSLSDTLDNVVGYISSGSGVISAVLTGVPILSAFVAFFVVFSVIRKVVGR